MDWSIQFHYDKGIDRVFINKFFYFLVSKGVKYYRSRYAIFTKSGENDIEYDEKESKESTELLAEIVEAYTRFNLIETSFSIDLDYSNEVNFYFCLYIIPIRDDKYRFCFETNSHELDNEKKFLTFINLCKEVFARFNFEYGAYRREDVFIPATIDGFLRENPDIINFYSKSMVEKIGRNKLLSAPAWKIEELENGGIMLIACENQLGCPGEISKISYYLRGR